MRKPWNIRRCTVLAVLVCCSSAAAQDWDVDFDLDINVGAEPGVHVLTRGPVHEAFAESITFVPEPGIVVARGPGELIEEIPPDQRPEGQHVAWIPGYWAWDDERRDFLWISGVWRSMPPGRQWRSGYWRPVGGGSQWVSGYWADADIDDVEYLPEPPDPIEEVVVTPPSSDHVWVPGVWLWQAGGYAWRPGYHAQLRTNWTWIPAHYVWSPRGYVFVDGYWDYVIPRRGVLFAPVHFDTGIVTGRVSYYSPRVAINLDVFTDHLFVRPTYHHYYFGDYYADHYHDIGFFPSFSFHLRKHGYDPIYAHRRWHHRHEPDWERRVEASYRYRRENERARPPRTLSAMAELRARRDEPDARSLFLATSIERMAKRPAGAVRFKTVEGDESREIKERVAATRKTREQRREMEDKDVRISTEKTTVERTEPVRAKVAKSPIVAKREREDDDDKSPPKRHVAPKPDTSVKPQPKKVKSEKAKEKKSKDGDKDD